ncbi:PI-PLC X domain-containing protein 1-like [Microplitis mediator]|uniref:PI-PLC X domain-containing protein 1-like n=1 Tax=Microplitis mediator TaxID=375433 RepID=UPI0025547549|nr:PI-PLC X domain-containing protein 1-like [Microplitis mediator]
MSGVVKTNVPPTGAIYLLNMTYVSQCVGYYGAWIRNNTIRKINCLSTHPDWMSRNKDLFEKMTLGKIFLPGTHNSGSYGKEIPRPLHSRYTRWDRTHDCSVKAPFTLSTETLLSLQDRDVFDQLVSGARYLDIRPCISNGDIRKYWVCHGPIFMHPLNGIIYDIKDFMTNTHEIVILSFREFPREYLKNHFDDFICLPMILPVESITLGNIWKSNKRLILSYDHPMQQTSTYLWPAISQFWPNAKTTDQLYNSIDGFENRKKDRSLLRSSTKIMRVTMAEMTLDAESVVSDSFAQLFGRGTESLFQLGVQVGPLLTEWYNQKYNSTANIVAVDFIDATGIVEVAIDANKLRASPYFVDDFYYY